jgi:hypothetical protein
MIGVQVVGTHPQTFRCGVPGTVVATTYVRGRKAIVVVWEDGRADTWLMSEIGSAWKTRRPGPVATGPWKPEDSASRREVCAGCGRHTTSIDYHTAYVCSRCDTRKVQDYFGLAEAAVAEARRGVDAIKEASELARIALIHNAPTVQDRQRLRLELESATTKEDP